MCCLNRLNSCTIYMFVYCTLVLHCVRTSFAYGVGSWYCIVENFGKFNTGRALNVLGSILIGGINGSSGSSLNRTSALGVDSEAIASSLKSWGGWLFSFSGLQDQYTNCTTKTCLHFRRLFSMVPATGISTRIMKKYMMEASCPMII